MKFYAFLFSILLFGSQHAQVNWSQANAGITGVSRLTSFASAPNGDLYVTGWGINTALQPYPVLFKSTNNGNTWSNVTIGSMSIRQPQALAFLGNKLFIGGKGSSSTHYVYYSTDFGANWSSSVTGLNQQYRVKDFATTGTGLIYLIKGSPNGNFAPRLYYSPDAGQSWVETNIVDLYPYIEPESIMFDKASNLYISGEDFNMPKNNLVYKSANYGKNWLPSNTGIPVGVTVNDMICGNASDIIGVCTETITGSPGFKYRLIKSSNAGASWSTIANVAGLDNLQQSAHAVLHNGYFFLDGVTASSSAEIYRSLMLSAPTVSTASAFDIWDLNATGSGTVINTGGAPVTLRGLCWSKSSLPTVANFTAVTFSLSSTFTLELTDLEPSTTYHVRAFATNSIGTSYGNEVVFTTLAPTAIGKTGAINNFEVFPSPAENVIYLKGMPESERLICIYDVTGRKLIDFHIQNGRNAIDISSLPPGIFMIEAGGVRRKFVKE